MLHGNAAERSFGGQPRFMDHRIRNEDDYFQHIQYMRLNPYKHESVKNEEEAWRWWFVHQNPFA